MKFDVLIADTNEFVISQVWEHVPAKGSAMHIHSGDEVKHFEIVEVVYDITDSTEPNPRYSSISVLVRPYTPLQSVP